VEVLKVISTQQSNVIHMRGAHKKKKMRKATADNDTLSTQPVLQVINKLNS